MNRFAIALICVSVTMGGCATLTPSSRQLEENRVTSKAFGQDLREFAGMNDNALASQARFDSSMSPVYDALGQAQRGTARVVVKRYQYGGAVLVESLDTDQTASQVRISLMERLMSSGWDADYSAYDVDAKYIFYKYGNTDLAVMYYVKPSWRSPGHVITFVAMGPKDQLHRLIHDTEQIIRISSGL